MAGLERISKALAYSTTIPRSDVPVIVHYRKKDGLPTLRQDSALGAKASF